ncbi:MAG TPA: hypothetical protein VL651_13160 [Bacteroidia bacterium]|jgi:hypothetical protein|nr:hypothetical protein [Bacteroidia bacterium]
MRSPMRSTFIILFSIFTCSAFAQKQYATFTADSSELRKQTGSNTDDFDEVMQMEWKMNGKVLRFGSSMKIKVNNQPDTIFFKQSENSKWDTIICLVKEPEKYYFVYNECCGGFDVFDDKDRLITASVIFHFEEKQDSGIYIGTLGETGIVLNTSVSDTLWPACHSALAPNIYGIGIYKIELCHDTAEDCDQYTCVNIPGMKVGDGFRRDKTYSQFLFLPLSSDPLEVNFDQLSGKLRLK